VLPSTARRSFAFSVKMKSEMSSHTMMERAVDDYQAEQQQKQKVK
jgi:hypothetical protein